MPIDLDVEPSRPVPDREAERPREPARRGHRREYDPREPRREFSDRVDGVVRDVAAFRRWLTDLITSSLTDTRTWHGTGSRKRSGPGDLAAAAPSPGSEGRELYRRRGDASRRGSGGAPVGAGRWEDQRGWSGAVKASDVGHECAVYRAALRWPNGSRRRAGASNGSGSMPNSRGESRYTRAGL